MKENLAQQYENIRQTIKLNVMTIKMLIDQANNLSELAESVGKSDFTEKEKMGFVLGYYFKSQDK